MIELIAIGVIVAVLLLGILFGFPRYVMDGWPDLLGRLDRGATSWTDRPPAWDAALGVVAIVLLGIATAMYTEAEIVGDLAAQAAIVAHPLAILGFVALFATAYLNVRRAGITGAEATFIGMSLAGSVLLVLIVALLLA